MFFQRRKQNITLDSQMIMAHRETGVLVIVRPGFEKRTPKRTAAKTFALVHKFGLQQKARIFLRPGA